MRQLLLVVALFCFNLSYTQDCQGSFDHQDLHGDDFIDRPFRCGTAMMKDRMYFVRSQREKKGYFDIEGVSFYDSQGYYKKKNKLYYSDHSDKFTLVPNGDIASLEIIGNFIRDKNTVYCSGKPQNIVDIKTFTTLENTPYAYDINHVYYSASRGGLSDSSDIYIVDGADPKSFESFCGELASGQCYYFAKDGAHVYYAGKLIQDADPKTFELDNSGYAYDKNFVYYNGEKMEGSSGSSFEKIDYYYVRDNNNVYFYGEIIPNMNGSKFELLGESGLGTDGVQICYRSDIIANGDPASFVDLGCGYYKDVNNVYSKGQILKSIESESFEVLSWGFTKDKNGVYCDDGIIPGADPASFEVMGRKYSRDKNQLFYLRTFLVNADTDSFRVDLEDPSIAEDSNATYDRGKATKK